MTQSTLRLVRWLTFGWTLVILYATLSEHVHSDGWLSKIPHFDKLVHFGIFCIWSCLLSMSLIGLSFARKYFLIVVLAGMVLGFGTEYLQSFVPGRSSDTLDFVADTLGVLVGLLFTFVIKKSE